MFQTKIITAGFVVIAFAMAGCSGSADRGGPSFATLSSDLATLQTIDASAFTPEADIATGSAQYTGVANIGFGTGAGPQDAALGVLTLNADFTGDTVDGSINNFVYFDQTDAPGSMAITGGALTGNNESGIGMGLTADASGTVGGNALDMDVEGHFAGADAEAVFLYFDGKTDSSLGVGIATK